MTGKLLKFALKIAALVAVGALGIFYGLANFDPENSPDSQGLRAVKVNSIPLLLLKPSEYGKIKDAGFNAILVSPKGYLVGGKVYTLPFTYSSIGYVAKKAHQNGLQIAVQPEIVVLDRKNALLNDRLSRDFLLTFYKNWGMYLNRVNAEYLLIPHSSLMLIPHEDRTSWMVETLKEIKTYYQQKTGFVVSEIFYGTERDSLEIDLLCMRGSLVKRQTLLKIPEIKGFDFVVFELFPPQEAKTINMFAIDFKSVDSILRKQSMRKGFGRVVYAGLNLPVLSCTDTRFKTAHISEDEQKVYYEKMLKLIQGNGSDFIVYEWDSSSMGIRNRGLYEITRKVLKGK